MVVAGGTTGLVVGDIGGPTGLVVVGGGASGEVVDGGGSGPFVVVPAEDESVGVGLVVCCGVVSGEDVGETVVDVVGSG